MKIRAVLILLTMLALFAGPARAKPLAQGSALIQVEPSGCPAGGCAPGQRLSYRLEFGIDVYDRGLNPNVKVCVYIPDAWRDAPGGDWRNSSVTRLDDTGGVTGVSYAKEPGCAEDPVPLAGYGLVAAGSASLGANYVYDSLNLSFRIASSSSGTGIILMRIFEQTSAGTWQRTSQVFTSQLNLAGRSASVYVASDPAACSASPCYLNSAGDLAGGLGTGLKDAIDTFDLTGSGQTVTVLGTVALKGNPVVVDKPALLVGGSGAALTVAQGSPCTPENPLLLLTAQVSLKNLTINDGSCTGTSDRRLVEINSPANVTIESNTLSGGLDAIRVDGNGGDVLARFNQISGNSGYALKWQDPAGSPSSAHLDLTANNLFNNRTGEQVDCDGGASASNPARQVDHNYWGSPAAPDPVANHCTLVAGRQLGAPVAHSPSGPGLDALKVSVGTAKTYAFNKLIAYQRGADGSDFDLFIINHGASPEDIPFPGGYAMPNPCSNAWDVFLADGAAPGGALNLFVPYSRSAACLSAIETSIFCAQTTSPQNYPLWWYDPRGQVTSGWDTTGQKPAGPNANAANGQTTSCDRTLHEIKVEIDASGRPNLADDLKYLPLLVGLPVTNSFVGLASDLTATLLWTTVNEPDTSGFIVLRATAEAGPFSAISDLIARRGSATTGGTYSYVDSGRTNGTALWYRLELVRTDDTRVLSDVVKVIPNIATPTLTPTITRTFTPTHTRTLFPTYTPYRLPTTAAPRQTQIVNRTATRAVSVTVTRSLMPGTGTPPADLGTPTPQGTQGLPTEAYPPPLVSVTPATPDLTESASKPEVTETAAAPTITATPSRTSAPTLSLGEQMRGSSKYISLVMGLLLGAVLVFGLGWVVFRPRRS